MAVRVSSDSSTGVFVVVGPLSELRAVRVDARGAEARTRSGLSAGASGPMYGDGGPLYTVRAGAVSIATQYPSRGASAYQGATGAVWVRGSPPEGAGVALQGYPELLRDGAVMVTAARDTERVPRCGFGLTVDGECVLASIAAGSIVTLARGMLACGVRDGAYLDGGTSAAWWAPGVRSIAARVDVPVVVGWPASTAPRPSPRPTTTPRAAPSRQDRTVEVIALVLLVYLALADD